MQYDMHYYGTYAMAAAAGIPKADAETIATAAQFVDDHNFSEWLLSGDDAGIQGIPTAHHPLEAGARAVSIDRGHDDSRLVWVPFHFLPGNEGATFHERMVARKDSPVARIMLDHYLDPDTLHANRSHALHLIGIAAHTYADTFSHYGFSGMPSDLNLVDPASIRLDASDTSIISYLRQKAEQFQAKFGATPRLGHGAVLTHPDRPYLKWQFTYQSGVLSVRSNPDTFLEACEALHARFKLFATRHYDAVPSETPWDKLKGVVQGILGVEASADDRVDTWMAAMEDGDLPGVQPCQRYDPDKWGKQADALRAHADVAGFMETDLFHFFRAADFHRRYVLKELLPGVGLLVA